MGSFGGCTAVIVAFLHALKSSATASLASLTLSSSMPIVAPPLSYLAASLSWCSHKARPK